MMQKEDYERESLKDVIYLLEEQFLLEQEFYKEEARKPALVLGVIQNSEKNDKENVREINSILPF